MKKITSFIIAFLILLRSVTISAQQSHGQKNILYDSALAAKLGADEYGMKKYYMVFLKRGNSTGIDSIERIKIQEGHLKNITRLTKENKLIIAGPFFGDQDLRGIFIFTAASIEDVKEWVKTDPAVKAGVLKTEILPWYASAGLMQVPAIHETIQKNSIIN